MRLLAYPFHDWRKAQEEGLRTRDHHVLEWLMKSGLVSELLVVDRPVSAAERIARRDGWHVEGQLVAERGRFRRKARLTRVDHGMLVLDQTSPSLLAPALKRRGWWFDAFEDPSTIEAIEWAVGQAGPFDACIAWQPAVAPALRASGIPFVFDSLDNWLIHPAFADLQTQTEATYKWIADNAHTLFVAAPASRDVFERWREDVVVVPNGVDVEHFTNPRSKPPDAPSPPVVGYTGKIGGRLDADLVAAVSASMPDVEFLLVGPVLEPEAVKSIKHLPNVTLLGDRHYSLLPAYIQAFDVAWIPHRVGQGETGGDLIKRYEYWAAGKHVVSTRIDGWEDWADTVDIVDDSDEAVDAIRRILDGTRDPSVPRIPPERTWKSIALRLIEPFASSGD